MKPATYKIFEAILHVLGFPLLLLVVILTNLNVFQSGAQYGVFAFVSVILVGVAALIYYIAYAILAIGENKRRSIISEKAEAAKNSGVTIPVPADPGRRTGIVLAIVVICMMCGLWIFVDVVLPAPLATATSSTLYWEDLADNWNARADVNEELLNTFITRAYDAGNLKEKTLAEYLDEGITNQEVKNLLNKQFQSIDKNGFASFTGPSIDFALTERMTIPALVHLLLDNREQDEDMLIPVSTFTAAVIPDNQKNLEDATEIQVGQNLTYLRSNKQFIAYTGTFDKVGAPMNSLIVIETKPSYIKVEYLASDIKKPSFVYIIDGKNGSLNYTYYSIKNGETSYEVFLNQKDTSSIELTLNDILSEDKRIYQIKSNDLLTASDGIYNLNLENKFDIAKTDFDGKVTNKTDSSFDELSAFDSEMSDYLNKIKAVLMLSKNDFMDTTKFIPVDWSYDKNESKTDASCVFEKTRTEICATWNVLDMLGEPMGFAVPLDAVKSLEIPVVNITGESLLNDYSYLIDDVLYTVGVLASNDAIVGSELSVSLDSESGQLSLTPSNVSRGTLDYMKMAWLQNNGLIYLIVSFFSLRKITYIFAPILAFLSYLIGFMREMSHGKPSPLKKQPELLAEESSDLDDIGTDTDL